MANNTHINCNGKRSNSSEGEDRLSSLPDEILIQILSFLPFLLVAKTSLLSRRWRYLWKAITNFEFQTLGIEFQTVVQILQHLTSPNIRIFKYSYSIDNEDSDFVYNSKLYQSHFKAAESCYHHILRRNVEILKVRSNTCVPAPNCLFNCESLVVLELDSHLHLNFEVDDETDLPINGATIYLPNLKKLRLRVDRYQYCFLRTLLKFCPKLEELYLILIVSSADVLEIFAPNLKCLTIINSMITPYSDIVIDAPKLAKLKIWDMCSYYSFQMVPASLVEASFNLRIGDDDPRWYTNYKCHDWTVEGHARAISKIIREMSSVSSLELQCFRNMHMFLGSADDGDMVVFHNNLTFFKAKLDSLVSWEDLLCSLHCFPDLKHLELNMDGFYFRGPRRWFAPIVLPDCLLSKLKKITLEKIKGTSDEIQLIELIFTHAEVLEELLIYAPTDPIMECKETQLWTEYKFCEALFNHPRSFLTCKIMFYGIYMDASYNVLGKGLSRLQIH